MTRLWDKGTPLDERVLRYTAGEDFALDERLVRVRRARIDRACAKCCTSRSCYRLPTSRRSRAG